MVVACRTQQLLNTSKSIGFARTIQYSSQQKASYGLRGLFRRDVDDRKNLRLCVCRSFHSSKEPRSALAKLSPQEVLLTGATADFYYPNCEYAGMSCLSCDAQKQCINFFGSLTYWATLSCSANVNNGYINPYCNPTTNTCTGIRPAGCPVISNYKCLRNGMFPELNDCTVYYNCTAAGSEQFVCGENYVYRQEYGKCVFKLSAADCFTVPSCGLKDSVALYPGDASLYYSCVASSLKFSACSETETYDLATKVCVGVCKSVGALPFTKNCSRYVACSESATGFVTEIADCPAGTGFNRNSGTCAPDYENLCNELALIEDDVSELITSIPIFGSLWGPIHSIISSFNINPFTLLLKFGLSDDLVSIGILVADYVYKYKTIPPVAVTMIVNFVLQYLPDDIRTIIQMMLQFGGLVSRSGPQETSLEVYLEDALLNVNVDVVELAQSLQDKTGREINAEITRGILRVFKIPDAQMPFFARLLAMNTPKIAEVLNGQLGVPLLAVTAANEVKLNVVCIDNALYNAVDNVAVKLYPGNVFVGELFKSYSKQQYVERRQDVVNFVDGFSFSFNTL